jgi:HEPN domain-containing protein
LQRINRRQVMEDKERILAALAKPSYSWRTVEGMSRETGIESARVLQIIESMPDLVIKSRIPDAEGRALYTTREYCRKTHSFMERLFDQFRSTST